MPEKNSPTPRRILSALCLSASLAPALAHVVVEPAQARAGGYAKLQFRISHGCEGAATLRVRIELPPDTVVARAQPKPGWTLQTQRSPLAQPMDAGHGKQLGEAVTALVWSGGPLPDEQFDEFALLMRLPDRPGATLHFPVLQDCEKGSLRWTEVPGDGKPGTSGPAPALRLLPR
jgi:uncharacterized protein YcnI